MSVDLVEHEGSSHVPLDEPIPWHISIEPQTTDIFKRFPSVRESMLRAIRFAVEHGSDQTKTEVASLAGEIANFVAVNFSASSFHEIFRPKDLAPGWSVERALDQWYKLAHLALTSATAQVFGDHREETSQLIRDCESRLITKWDLSDAALNHFKKSVADAEASAAFSACTNGEDLFQFAARYTDTILGVPVSLSVTRKDFPLHDYLANGLEPRASLALSRAVWQSFFDTFTSVRNMLVEFKDGSENRQRPTPESKQNVYFLDPDPISTPAELERFRCYLKEPMPEDPNDQSPD